VHGTWKPTGRKAAGPHTLRPVFKPTGRKAAGEPRWTPYLLVVRPTPHGVGLGRRPGDAHGGPVQAQCEPV